MRCQVYSARGGAERCYLINWLLKPLPREPLGRAPSRNRGQEVALPETSTWRAFPRIHSKNAIEVGSTLKTQNMPRTICLNRGVQPTRKTVGGPIWFVSPRRGVLEQVTQTPPSAAKIPATAQLA